MSIEAVRESRLASVKPESPAPEPSEPAPVGPSVFAVVLRGLGREVERGEALVHTAIGAARGGRDVGPAELIALQAGVYRYGEAVDLASRLIDRAATSVKTVLQGQ
jgi:hypothetical protein